ncbi:MAG: hypothetical protein KGJ62_01625 [Armatimonadetes bacterium]|nr:hypothetical protein [Armatimonadota bacterium]MDE2205480.1 hypothetical protein [Armatimonadota bacterium]
MTLEQEFLQDMIGGDDILRKQYGYNATYFRQMVAEHGGVEAARLLLRSKDAQAGLTTLWELGRLDMSMEQLVLRAKYRSLFTEEERAIARKRLRDLGYEPRMD